MKAILKTAVLATGVSMAMTMAMVASAQAAVISFDGLAESPLSPNLPFLGHGDVFSQSGFVFEAFSNQAGAQPGDLVGAIVDGSDIANTCFSVACPTNNSSKFYTALNDGVLHMAAMNGGSFTLKGLDASFVGAGGEVFPGTTLLLYMQGSKAGGGTMTDSFALPGPSNGQFGFQSYLNSGAFAAQQFTEIYFYGLACDAGGSCSAFSSNKGQFALDNINVTAAVPEPSSWLLMGLGLSAFAALARRRKAV